MTHEISIEINLLKQNDLSKVESIVYPIFSKTDNESQFYWRKIRSLFLTAMKNAKLNWIRRNVFWLYVDRAITKGQKEGIPLIKVENKLRKFLRRHTKNGEEKNPLSLQRAKLNFENLRPYLKGEKLLDLGAGDGLLALEIKRHLNKEIILVDVLDYNSTDLPLLLYKPEDKIPLRDKEVDTTIIYTVLHHTNDPYHLLVEAMRVTKNRIIIKEADIEKEENRISNSFFDWFYNRVLGDEDINVPLNFLKIEEWKKILSSYGFEVIKTKHVGIDEPIIPEFHVFMIAEKIIP
jgi:2-polyprenyl-3-methyl-5-hydroxy-6-metoxy-1,4-benzoquinol methylase